MMPSCPSSRRRSSGKSRRSTETGREGIGSAEERAGAEIGTANVDVRESERCRNREGCCGKYTIYSEASTSAQTAFKVKSNSCSVLKITALCTESPWTHRDESARQRSLTFAIFLTLKNVM